MHQNKTLPIGVLMVLFSYTLPKDCFQKLSLLSKKIREYLKNSAVLDQERLLTIRAISKNMGDMDLFERATFHYALELCTKARVIVECKNWE